MFFGVHVHLNIALVLYSSQGPPGVSEGVEYVEPSVTPRGPSPDGEYAAPQPSSSASDVPHLAFLSSLALSGFDALLLVGAELGRAVSCMSCTPVRNVAGF